MPYTKEDYLKDLYIKEHGKGYERDVAADRVMLYEHGHIDKIENMNRAQGRSDNGKHLMTVEEYEKKLNELHEYYNKLRQKVSQSSDNPNPAEWCRLSKEYQEEADKLTKEIEEANKIRESQQNTTCYIATCVYGSYDCPEVWVLRRYRDYELTESIPGRLFVKIYYACSPIAVKMFGNQKWFKNMWRPVLDKMVRRLSEKGYSDKPYEDRY
jgi:hypothetical protein